VEKTVLEVAEQWLPWEADWMLMQGLCPASEPHVLTTKHLVMDPVIQCVGNPLELASVAASLSQFVNFSIRTVVCVSPLDSVALSATVSIRQ
jgi:hypothetical protein